MTETQDPPKVVPIDKPKRKAESPKARLYQELVMAIRGENPLLPAYQGHRYHVTSSREGMRLLLREGAEGVVTYVNSDDLAAEIMRYANRRVIKEKFMLTFTAASEVARMYMHDIEPIPEPAPVLQAHEDGLTFHRLPFDIVENPKESDCPIMAEFLSRTSNAYALTCFVGSLLDPKADRQQYVWMYGEGQNGKGRFSQFLRRLLGPSYAAEEAGVAESNNFWTSGLMGKRLVVFPDCNNVKFVKSGKFKSLTGDDPVRIELKNKQPFTAELVAKFLFLSNAKPDVSGDTSERRRIIFCDVGPISGPPDPNYLERAWAEAPAFLGHCVANYKASCPDHGPIPVDQGVNDDLIAENEEKWESIIDRRFVLAPERNIKRSHLVQILAQEGIKQGLAVKDFKSYLRRRGITETKKSPRYFVGIGVADHSFGG